MTYQALANDTLARMKASLTGQYGLANLDEWITRYTFLNDKPFTFDEHEFQLDILRDPSLRKIVVKCAQVGISELMYRWAIASCCAIKDFTVIYTFPTATDAEDNNRTRINPMINSSPEVLRLINPDMNNSAQKQFGKNSFLFFKGTKSATQALSTPADAVVNDEFDKSDIEQASVYESRLQHKPHKIRTIFSTPTVDRYGVSKEAETARRYRRLCACSHCNHMFIPDYYEHVVVPDWNKPLEEIVKANIHLTRWREAYLQCPRCKRNANLSSKNQEYVLENQSEQHDAAAFYVTPFNAPGVISIPYLVDRSTKYEKISEFKNQTLGLTAEEENESLTLKDIENAQMFGGLDSSELHYMGGDIGRLCRIVIGRVGQNGEILIVHREKVYYMELEKRVAELYALYRITFSVFDYQPETAMIARMTKRMANFWGAMFITSNNPVMSTPVTEEEDARQGQIGMRFFKINRTVALDALLDEFKRGNVVINKSDENDIYKKELLSLKRVQKFDKQGGIYYAWDKTDGEDHYHFATLYFYIAVQNRLMSRYAGAAGMGVPLVARTRVGGAHVGRPDRPW